LDYNLDDFQIRSLSKSDIYERGVDFYYKGNVKNIFYNEGNNVFTTFVKDNRNYRVNIFFNENTGKLKLTECNCPAFIEHSDCCEHIIASLLKIQQFIKNSIKSEKNLTNNKNRDFLFHLFEMDTPPQDATCLDCEVYLNAKPGNQTTMGEALLYLSLKIGTNRMYSVKSMNDFIKSTLNKTSITYSKNFTYEPNIHLFKEPYNTLINYMKDMYNDWNNDDSYYYGYQTYNYLFQNKYMNVTSRTIRDILKILQNTYVHYEVSPRNYEKTLISSEPYRINARLRGSIERIILDFPVKKEAKTTDKNLSYIYSDKKIHFHSANEAENLKKLLGYINTSGAHETVFDDKTSIDRFVKSVFPKLYRTADFEIVDSLKNSISIADPSKFLYFDTNKKSILCKPVFKYSDIEINILNENASVGNKLIIRSTEAELKTLKELYALGFEDNNNILSMQGDEEIFEFVFNSLPKLQEDFSVFYSDSFKKIKTISPKTSFNLCQSNNELLEFNFDIDGINNDELPGILRNLQIKKKYFRLKDGSYLPIYNDDFQTISDIMETTGLTPKEFSKKIIHLPMYRALYLEQKLRNKNSDNFNVSKEVTSITENIRKTQSTNISVPTQLKKILRKYQEKGFKWMHILLSAGLGCILADDMGLGKTLQVLTLILSDNNKKEPALIIVPTSLLYNWEGEIKKFTPELKTLIISGSVEKRAELIKNCHNYDIVITSYPLIRRDIDELEKTTFSYCILDEAQYIKNHNSITSKSVKLISANKKLALTGTPIENSLIELWSIFDFLMPGFLLSLNKFRKRYESNPEMLSSHVSPFILRRLKVDVLQELPDKIESCMVAELETEQKKIYLSYLRKIKGEIEQSISNRDFNNNKIKILAELVRLRQICCHPSLFIENYTHKSGKMELLFEILEESIESGHRILLFSQFTTMLAMIRKKLDNLKIKYKYLDGSTKPKDRLKIADDFNNGSGSIFLISLKAGGTGLNLTGADIVIHYDPWWNPAVEDQATDRAYRIGQTKAVQVIKLITKGTIEEKIHNMQKEKKEMIDRVIKPGETPLSKLTEKDIQKLLGVD
jgi:SNF2 family DNA or RNA helicase